MSGTTALRLDDQLCFALYAATNSITRSYRPLLRGIGLTYPQYLVMMVLWQEGDSPVGRLAARLDLPTHALTPLVTRLEAAGLVVREKDERDARVRMVRLTPAGEDLEIAAAHIQRSVVCQTGLSSQDLAGLRGQLHQLSEQLRAADEQGQGRPVEAAS